MDELEWTPIVDRLNANYPGQELRPETAVQWFEALGSFPAAEVEAAVERVIWEREWMPTGVAVILNAIDANWDDAKVERHEQAALEARSRRNARGGVTAPPEFKQALRLLERSKLPPYHPDHLDPKEARRLIDGWADQLEARVERRQETVADATRTCPECATSNVEGWVDVVEDGVTAVHPCPMCRPGRRSAWQQGRMAAKADKGGYPARRAAATR